MGDGFRGAVGRDSSPEADRFVPVADQVHGAILSAGAEHSCSEQTQFSRIAGEKRPSMAGLISLGENAQGLGCAVGVGGDGINEYRTAQFFAQQVLHAGHGFETAAAGFIPG